jgi:PAS domain S-box-containing protein
MIGSINVGTRLRQLGPVGVVLVLTAVGFFVLRAHGESDARHDSSHRAEIAATRVRDHVAQASTLVDGVRRFLVSPDSDGATAEQFAEIGARWLAPVGLPAAAWLERVPGGGRADYERRTGRLIVVPTSSGGIHSADLSTSYLPATLVTGSPPLTSPGLDLGSIPGVASAVARPETAYRVSATPMARLPDGTTGLFLVQSAQRLNRGVVEPGFVVVFVPSSWLLAGATDAGGSTPGVQVAVGGAPAGDLGNVPTAESTFAAAGQPFAVRVPRSGVHGAAALQPWLVGGAGLMLAALAAALGVIGERRARAKAELDRLFAITPDLIVVAGFDGYLKRVNPAFTALLGYTEAEVLARPYLDYIHPDDRERTQSERSRLREGETTDPIENRYVCKDGSYKWIEWTATPVHEERVSYAVGRDVTERRRTQADLRNAEERNRELAEEQATLRRVATLVARAAPPEELFAAVSEEVGHVLGRDLAGVGRYNSDETVTVLATWAAAGEHPLVPGPWPLGGGDLASQVWRTGRPVRIDDYQDARGPIAAFVRDELGISSSIGHPIVVEGRLWGVLFIHSKESHGPLPPDTEARLANFTELVATAVANAENRAKIGQLAEEQAALRRVATLVARGTRPADVFAAVAEEVGRVLEVESTSVVRYEADESITVVAISGRNVLTPVGSTWTLEGDSIAARVFRTGRPARINSFDGADGVLAELARELGRRSAVGAPITVDGRLWGAAVANSVTGVLPAVAEDRLAKFAELVAMGISNAEARTELTASRARVVAAADETRRRIERDLHDGIQQRLVSLALQARATTRMIPRPSEEIQGELTFLADQLSAAFEELREISRGIHPAILSEAGLGAALKTLARRSAVPVALDLSFDCRLEESVEVATYYIASEALTNAVKHAQASIVELHVDCRGGVLTLEVRDDGIGGADPGGGSGLIGLKDRVEALGGTISVASPPDQGTALRVLLPIDSSAAPTSPPTQRSATA